MTSQNRPDISRGNENKDSQAIIMRSRDIHIPMNKSFGRRLNRLIWDAIDIQYNLACLSTLGGAYHLCNHPETALIIALRQEKFAIKLGSTTVMLRSKVFQAVNLGLIGRKKECAAMFRYCKNEASKEGWTEMSGFVEASRKWLEIELGQRLLRQKESENIEIGQSANGSYLHTEHFPISMAVQELKEY